jgi:hypothetical protein
MENSMSATLSDTLQTLRFELSYLELGGLERDRAFSTVKSPFRESSACMNFGDPMRPHACSECSLYQFVPEEKRDEEAPCHHIPLNDSGETVAALINRDPRRMVVVLEQWLRTTIAKLEALPGSSTGQ